MYRRLRYFQTRAAKHIQQLISLQAGLEQVSMSLTFLRIGWNLISVTKVVGNFTRMKAFRHNMSCLNHCGVCSIPDEMVLRQRLIGTLSSNTVVVVHSGLEPLLAKERVTNERVSWTA